MTNFPNNPCVSCRNSHCSRKKPVRYDLDRAIERLHEEGRYRTFIDIERKMGQFPHATWRKTVVPREVV